MNLNSKTMSKKSKLELRVLARIQDLEKELKIMLADKADLLSDYDKKETLIEELYKLIERDNDAI